MTPPPEGLRERLRAIGFDVVRFAAWEQGAMPEEPLRSWLRDGMQADMDWMGRTAEKRLDPSLVLAGAKAVIVLGVNYGCAPGQDGSGGRRPDWAKYAQYSDYHDTMKAGLEKAGKLLETECGAAPTDYRYYVDTGPILERSWAARAGMGFLGKNAMLISPDYGNWLFLAAILTRFDWASDRTWREKAGGVEVGAGCGKCTRCLSACPTGAITRPGVVDARLCISYQTIENRGMIPRALRQAIGQRVYGCDTCLDVCPWNRFARASRSLLLEARPEIARLDTAEILALTPERFAEVFRKTPVKRLKLAGLLRNACIVAANTERRDCLEQLVLLARHERPLVRAHAVWAVYRLAGSGDAERRLAAALAAETDASVLAEYEAEDAGEQG